MSTTPAHKAPAALAGPQPAADVPPEALRSSPLRMAIVGSGTVGPERAWVERAAQAFLARGHEVELLQIAGTRGDERAEVPGVVVHDVPARTLDPRAALALARVVRGWRPHVLLAGDRDAVRWIAAARFFLRLPPLYAARIGNETALPKGAAALGAALLTPGARLEDGIPMASGIAVSADEIPPDRTRVRRQLRLPRRRELLLQVGRFERGSGHETTLRALARLRALRGEASPRFSLVLVGTGPEETRLHELSHELRLQEHVLWIGHRHDPEPYVRAADLLVVPTPGACSGFEIRAALAGGTPVVAARAIGVRAGITHEETAVLVSEGDAEALAEALARLTSDPARAAALVRAGRAQAAATDSPETLGLELECLTLAGLLRPARRPVRSAGAGRPAVILDRDGTLVRNVPYNADPAAVELEPGAAWALRCFATAGLARVVVSNQSAVARGLCSETDVLAVNERLRELLRAGGGELEAIHFCPHHPDHGPPCDCRKPEPGLLLRAARDLGLDLARSVTVGDEPRDLEAGRRAGTATVRYSGDWLRTCSAALSSVLRRSNRD